METTKNPYEAPTTNVTDVELESTLCANGSAGKSAVGSDSTGASHVEITQQEAVTGGDFTKDTGSVWD